MTLFTRVLSGLALAVSISFSAHAAPLNADQAQVARGEYLAHAGDCIACHTAHNGKPFAGGLPIQTPLGKIYSTNITPDAKTGIGTWSYEDFAALMRHGETKSGYAVYPAMPYPSYSRVNEFAVTVSGALATTRTW